MRWMSMAQPPCPPVENSPGFRKLLEFNVSFADCRAVDASAVWHPSGVGHSFRKISMHSTLTSVSDLTPRLGSLYYHWCDACRGGPAPRLTALDLHRLSSGMDTLVVTEILRLEDGTPRDFQFVYIGRTIHDILTEDMSGRHLSDYPDKGPDSRIGKAYMAMAQDPHPRLVRLPYVGPNPTYTETLELFLPVTDDIGTPRYVIVGIELIGRRRPRGANAVPGEP